MAQEEDPFEAAVRQIQSSQNTAENGKLTSLFNSSQEIPGDQASEVLSLMGRTGVDADLIYSNLAEARKLAPNTDWEAFKKSSPILARWYSQSPYHMKVGETDRTTGAALELERQYYRKDDASRPLTKEETTLKASAKAKRFAPSQFAQMKALEGKVSGDGVDLYQGPVAASIPEMEKQLAERYGKELEEDEQFIERLDKVGMVENFGRKGIAVPLMSTLKRLGQGIDLYQAAKDVTAGTADEDQRESLLRYKRLSDAAERRGMSVGGMFAEIVSETPSFVAEFAATGGAYTAGKKAAEKVIEGALKRVIAPMIGAAAQTAVMSGPRIAEDTVRRMTPGLKITPDQKGELGVILDPKNPGDQFGDAFLKAAGSQYVEVLSERTGASVEKLSGFLKARLFKEYVRLHPAEGVAGFLGKIKTVAGWNGILGEMFEERVGEVMRAGLGIEPYQFPSPDQLAAEFLAFSVPASPMAVVERLSALKNKSDAEYREEKIKDLAKSIQGVEAIQKTPEVGQRMIEDVSKGAAPGKFGYIDPHEFAQFYEQKGLDPIDAAVELMGTAEPYKQAIISGHEFQAPRSRIDSVILADPEAATYFQDKILDKPGQLTVKQTKAVLDKLDAAEKAVADQEKAVKQVAVDTEKNAEKLTQIEASVTKISQQIQQGLEAAGRKAEASHMGEVVGNLFKRLGEMQKADPYAIFQKKPITINAPLGQGEAQLEQPNKLRYQLAGEVVDGRRVRAKIPNTDSISSSIDHYEELPGIREVPLSAFKNIGKPKYYSASEEARTKALAEEIRQSGEIAPLIVVEDANGPYILEGGHRFDALLEIGAKSFPALVVLDVESLQGKKRSEYHQPSRGFIQIGNARLNIQLPKGADKSTFLHETKHAYIEVLADLAVQADVSPEIKEHFQILLDWWGVKDAATWHKMSFAEKEPYHEKAAKAFEKYAMEGKAPSKGLRKVFYQAWKWLTSIYKDNPGYFAGIELTPELKRFMDLALATEEEIEAAQAEYGLPLYDALVKAGLPPDKAAKLAQVTEEAKEAASSKLRAKAMMSILREEQSWWNDEKEALKKDAALTVDQQEVYRALSLFKTGALPDGEVLLSGSFPVGQATFKLRKAFIKDIFSDPQGNVPESIPSYVYTASEEGMHPDVVASWFRFDSGRAFLEAIANAEPREQLIDRLASEHMYEKYGEQITRETVAAEAEKAVHNVDQQKRLKLELESLVDLNLEAYKAGIKFAVSKPRVPDIDVINQRAQDDIGKLEVKAITPALYKAAEIKAGKASLEAALKGDLTTATEQKTVEILNQARFIAAKDAREAVKDELDNARKLAKTPSDSKDLDWVNAQRAIYAAYGIGRFEKRATKYLQQLKEYDVDTYNVVQERIADVIANARNYKDVTYQQFKAMSEEVAAVGILAKETKTFFTEGKNADFDEVKAQVLEAAKALSADYAGLGMKGEMSLWQKIKLKGLSLKAAVRRVESWADAKGPVFTKYVFDPVNEGTIKYAVERVKIVNEYAKYVRENKDIFDAKPIVSTDLGFTFENKGQLIGALLHSGNESNLMKLLVGYKWGDTDEGGNLDISRWERFRRWATKEGHITKKDYDFVQAVWDLNESLRPVAQKAFKQKYGGFFAEIPFDAIKTDWGDYKGGYVPAKVDPRLVQDGAIRQAEQDDAGWNTYSYPTTYSGFTKARSAGYAKPLNLDLRLIPKHFDEVLRFAYIEPRTRDVRRLLSDPEVNAALAAHDPKAFQMMLVPWLQDATTQKGWKPGLDPGVDQFWRYVRRNAGLQLMTLNVVNALQNTTGFSVAATKVKPALLMSALQEFMTNHEAMAEEIMNSSEYMKLRIESEITEAFKEIDDIITNPNAYQKIVKAAEKHGSILQRLTQNPLDLIAWKGAYVQATEEGKPHEEAVRAADAVVRLTQGGFRPEDKARYEKLTPFLNILSQFSGYWNMKANLNATEYEKTVRELGLQKGAGKLFYLYTMSHMIPALVAAIIMKSMSKGWDDEDEDGYLDEVMAMFFGAQFREGLAMVPFAGKAADAALTAFGATYYGDRIMTAPAISLLEAAVREPGEVYRAITEGKGARKAVKDTLSLIGLFSGLPTGPLGKPAGYLMDVESGREEPTGPFDFTRGLITGRSEYKK